MTCIVAVSDGKDVWFGADKQRSGWLSKSIIRMSKIWSKNGFVMGGAGYAKFVQVCQYRFIPPYRTPEEDIETYMATSFTDTLKKTLNGNDCIETNKGLITSDSYLLVGYEGRLFNVDIDLGIDENKENYGSIGSGFPYALGSLATTEDSELTQKERIEKALEVASRFAPGVGNEYDFITTKEDTDEC